MAEAEPDPIGNEPGKFRDGFNMLFRDFDRAIALAFLSGLQTFLLQRAREASWTAPTLGWQAGQAIPDARPFLLDIPTLALFLGRGKESLYVAFRELIAKGIFKRLDSGMLMIEKNYKLWKEPETGGQLLTTNFIVHALEAKTLKVVNFGQENLTRQSRKVDSSQEKLTNVSMRSQEKLTPTECGSQENLTVQSRKVDSGITEERAAPAPGIELIQQEETNTSIAGASRTTIGCMDDSSDQIKPQTEGRIPVPEGYDRVCSKAESMSELNGFGPWLRGTWAQDARMRATWEEFPDVESWCDALLVMVGQDAERMNPNFFRGVAKKKSMAAKSGHKVNGKPKSNHVPAEGHRADPNFQPMKLKPKVKGANENPTASS